MQFRPIAIALGTALTVLGGAIEPSVAAILVRGGVTQIIGPGLGTVEFTPESGDPSQPGVDPVRDIGNNDFSGPDENQNQVGLELVRFDAVAPIDIEFVAFNVWEGGTEYLFKETVLNNTGLNWGKFSIQLGFGTGRNFIQSGLRDRLDFDTFNALGQVFPFGLELADLPLEKTPTPTSTAFAQLDHQANILQWQNGKVRQGQSVDFTFSLDLPNLSALNQKEIPQANWLLDDQGQIVGYKFTLRQSPHAVPEPSAVLGLIGIGLLSVGRIRKQKH
ncbi:PEP-CTERM sorting domain-containing protein [Oscillatoria amoena NRMC-F 0135]|nr:PEP-CTERM sorting domain-containing protein [Oscillatoria amoena NRMC-F 0135]